MSPDIAQQKNPDFELAFRIIESTDTNLFLTGRAGTGKTTFLRNLMQRSHKQIVVAAPTGIAAINSGGVTLHSLFQLDFGLFLPGKEKKPFKFSKAKLNIIRYMDVLVIDEVSMVRADLLDAVDDALRRLRNPHLPFGGVQLLLIGDLQQLPPVVTDEEAPLLAKHYSSPYFFSSHALAHTNYVMVELKKIYRQDDEYFINILGEVRSGTPSPVTIEAINKRYIPNFKPKESDHWVRLTSHNHLANKINKDRMEALNTTPYSYDCAVEGNWPKGVYPAEEKLVLKRGAQVMFVKNEGGQERRYFNGMLGIVSDLDENSVTVAPDNGDPEIEVSMVEWENITYKVNPQTRELHEEVDGIFKQIPLRPAWAITIHKSQGLTFTRAIVDAASCFAHGQAYVALSRLRSLDGLVLNSPIPARAIISDSTINRFIAQQSEVSPQDEMIMGMELKYELNLLNSIYDFTIEEKVAEELHHLVVEAYGKKSPSLVQRYGDISNSFSKEVVSTGKAFAKQYTYLIATPDSRPMLTERLAKSAGFFPAKIDGFAEFLRSMPLNIIGNAVTLKRVSSLKDRLLENLSMKSYIISSFADTPFSARNLLKVKHEFMVNQDREKGALATKRKSSKSVDTRSNDKSEELIKHPEVFRALVQWRKEESKRQNVRAYTLLTNRALIKIANNLPQNAGGLLMIKGCGPKIVNQYGEVILGIIREATGKL